jgi:hypothetical protein
MKTKTSNHHYKAKNKVRKATASSLLSTIGGFSFFGWHQFHFLSSSFIHFNPTRSPQICRLAKAKKAVKRKVLPLKDKTALRMPLLKKEHN